MAPTPGLVTYSMNISLDGYIVGPDGGFDWSEPDEEVFAAHTEELRGIGVHLLGRRLHETMWYWETADQEPQSDYSTVEWARMWRAVPKVVFSRTLTEVTGTVRLAVFQSTAHSLLPRALAALGERHPGRGLPSTRALQDRTCLVEPVLLHARQVRMTGAGPRQRTVPGDLALVAAPRIDLQRLRRHRVGGHHRLPLGPLGVVDAQGDRRAHRDPVAHTPDEGDPVGLEGHAGPPAVPEPSPPRARARSSVVTPTPAGTPSRTPVRASPCDSPAVNHLSMVTPYAARGAPVAAGRRCPRRWGAGRS